MQQRVILVGVLIVTLVLSIIFGTAVGEGDYVELSIYAVIALIVCYFAFAYKWTWQLILFISYLGFNYIHGFSIEASHLAIILLSVYTMIAFFKGNVARPPVLFRQCGSRFLSFLCLLWLLYGGVHFCANMAFPYIPNEYSMKNALKAYFMAFMPPALLLWMLVGPISFRLGDNWGRTLVIVMFVALTINIISMGYLFMQGYGVSDPAMVQGGIKQDIGFHIPVINAVPNIFVLRALGASAILLAFAMLSFKEWKARQSKALIFMLWCLCGLGFIGCLISGGRASVLVAGLYILLVCLSRKRIGLIALGAAVAAICIGLANVFSDWVNHKAPLFVSRPLQYMMIDKGDAMESIDSSSEYRASLYKEALAEWSSDPRLLLMGRSVYKYMDDLVELKVMYGDKEAFLITNLRAGSCHALLPSVLLQYGLIGAILYYSIYLAMIALFWRIYRRSANMDPTIQVVVFVMAVSSTVGIVIATIGGGWFAIGPVVILGLLRTAISQEEQAQWQLAQNEESSQSPAVGGNHFANRPRRPFGSH